MRYSSTAEGTDLPKCEGQEHSADHVGESIVQEGVAGTPSALLYQVPDHRPAQPMEPRTGISKSWSGDAEAGGLWWGGEDARFWERGAVVD